MLNCLAQSCGSLLVTPEGAEILSQVVEARSKIGQEYARLCFGQTLANLEGLPRRFEGLLAVAEITEQRAEIVETQGEVLREGFGVLSGKLALDNDRLLRGGEGFF